MTETIYRHKVRGTQYKILAFGRMLSNDDSVFADDMDVYICGSSGSFSTLGSEFVVVPQNEDTNHVFTSLRLPLQEWRGKLQYPKSQPLMTNCPVVIYQDIDNGSIWVRLGTEFFDGRFERIDPPVTKPDTSYLQNMITSLTGLSRHRLAELLYEHEGFSDASNDDLSPDRIVPEWIDRELKNQVHSGDCTKECHPCMLCHAKDAIVQWDDFLTVLVRNSPSQTKPSDSDDNRGVEKFVKTLLALKTNLDVSHIQDYQTWLDHWFGDTGVPLDTVIEVMSSLVGSSISNTSVLREIYGDDRFDKMVAWVRYATRQCDGIDVDEDVAVMENSVAYILKEAHDASLEAVKDLITEEHLKDKSMGEESPPPQ